MPEVQKNEDDLRKEVEGLLRQQSITGLVTLVKNLGKEGMEPGFAKWLAEQAGELHKLGRFDEQRQIYELTAPYIKDGWDILHRLGYSFQLLGDFTEARNYYKKALALKPDYLFSQLALGQLEMMETNFTKGRDSYELRFLVNDKDSEFDFRDIPSPRWRGENLAGKTIYLWAEQGVGDVVMFASFLPKILAEKPKQVIIGMVDKLIPLFKRSFPEIEIEPLEKTIDYAMAPIVKGMYLNLEQMLEGAKAKDSLEQLKPAYQNALRVESFDYAAPMGDLMVYGLPKFIPARKQGSYLKADEDKLVETKKMLAKNPGRNIGISWFTSNNKDGVIRNIPLEAWSELLNTADCNFYSLQHHIEASEVDGFNIIQPGFDPAKDIESLVALISALDGVITIDNSNAHIAGALGIDTILLLPKGYNFRWPEKDMGSKTIWYKSVKTRRQAKIGDWKTVMDRVTKELRRGV